MLRNEVAAVIARSRGVQLLLPALLLAAYGNAASMVLMNASTSGGWGNVVVGFVPAVLMLGWAWRFGGLSLPDFGVVRHRAVWSGLVGLAVAFALALPVLVVLRAPPWLGGPVSHAPLNMLALDSLLLRAFVWMPLDTALPEEIAFRGVLLGALMQRFDASRAVLLSAGVFTVWHTVIVARTVGVTNLSSDPLFMAIGFVGSLASVFVGGLIFAMLRLSTGNLTGSIVAHWGFNSILLLGLYSP
jgi:CAAX protease family protein